MVLYRPDEKLIRPGFMRLSLMSETVQKRMVDLAGGSTVGHIRVGDIRSLNVHVTSLSEQLLISEKFESGERSLEEEVESLVKLYKLKSGLMDDLLTGRVRVTDLQTQTPNP
jgi:type I restriction enzyme S subunit